jgi:peptidoglycan/LPS O-acetylase OafA/YrhL
VLPAGNFSKFTSKTDISYGVYLYAWPIQKLINHFNPTLGVWQGALLTAVLASVAGWMSWVLWESKFKNRRVTLVEA